MDGITILNSYADVGAESTIICGLFFLFIAFIFFFGALITDEGLLVAFATPFAVISFTLLIVGFCQNATEPKRMIYEVTIDDNVSLSEFMDKYTILEVDGKIYTICEKEEND